MTNDLLNGGGQKVEAFEKLPNDIDPFLFAVVFDTTTHQSTTISASKQDKISSHLSTMLFIASVRYIIRNLRFLV